MRGCEGRLRGKGDGWGGCGSGGKKLLGPDMVLPAPTALHLRFVFDREPHRHAKQGNRRSDCGFIWDLGTNPLISCKHLIPHILLYSTVPFI
jgi:hypothetical protein